MENSITRVNIFIWSEKVIRYKFVNLNVSST